MTNKEIIDEIVRTCAHELFAQYDTPLEPAAKTLDPHDYVAVIAFYGDNMRGSVGLGLDRAVVARMLDAESAGDARIIEDCTGEAANQLVGRMKNKLLSYGVALGIALPIVLRGLAVHLASPATDVWPYRFTSPSGGLTVWFDGQIDPDVVLTEQQNTADFATREGEVTMF